MITLYKDGQSVTVHRIDARGWINDGWTMTPTPTPAISKADTSVTAPEPQVITESANASGNSSNGTSPSASPTVNVNTATVQELETIRGVGNKTALEITSKRPFTDLKQLTDEFPAVDWYSQEVEIAFS